MPGEAPHLAGNEIKIIKLRKEALHPWGDAEIVPKEGVHRREGR